MMSNNADVVLPECETCNGRGLVSADCGGFFLEVDIGKTAIVGWEEFCPSCGGTGKAQEANGD